MNWFEIAKEVDKVYLLEAETKDGKVYKPSTAQVLMNYNKTLTVPWTSVEEVLEYFKYNLDIEMKDGTIVCFTNYNLLDDPERNAPEEEEE